MQTEVTKADWKALYDATYYWQKVGERLVKEVLSEVRDDPSWHNDPDRECLINKLDRWVNNKE